MVSKTLNMASLLENSVKIAFWLLTLFVGLLTYQGQQALQAISNHETRLITMEANLYTVKDAADAKALERAEMKEFIRLYIDPIKSSLSDIKTGVTENRAAIRDIMQ